MFSHTRAKEFDFPIPDRELISWIVAENCKKVLIFGT